MHHHIKTELPHPIPQRPYQRQLRPRIQCLYLCNHPCLLVICQQKVFPYRLHLLLVGSNDHTHENIGHDKTTDQYKQCEKEGEKGRFFITGD